MSVQRSNAELFYKIGKIAQDAFLEGVEGIEIIPFKAFYLAKIVVLGFLDVPELLTELVFIVVVALFKKVSDVDYHHELSPKSLSMFREETIKLKKVVEFMKDPSNDLDTTVSFSALRSVLLMVGSFDPKVFSADLAVMTLEKIASRLMKVDVSEYGS